MARAKPARLPRKEKGGPSVGESPPRSSAKPVASAWQREVARRHREEGLDEIPLTDYLGWLILAADAGVLEEVKRFVELGANVNEGHVQVFGHTALTLGARSGSLDVVWYLVEHGADINRATSGGSTCLETAILSGHLEVVQYLVEHGGDVNHVGKDGNALACALHWRHIPIYEYLKPFFEPRQQAIIARRLPEALISSEAETDRVHRLSEACARGLAPTVQRQIKQGIDVNARTGGYRGQTPLRLASRYGHEGIVEALLAAGADPNIESYIGETPLMDMSNAHICRKLLAAGADVNAADDEGGTVLMWVRDAECCRLLLEAGARTDAVDDRGRGVLMHIAWWVKRRQELGWPHQAKIDDRFDRNLADIFRQLIAAGAATHVSAEEIEAALACLADLKVPKARQALQQAEKASRRTK